MSKYVSSNAKYYKKTQIKGLLAHIDRKFKNDANVFKELSHENFEHKFADFEELEQRMLKAKTDKGLRARGFQKDANVMVDNVLIFSRERVEQLKIENPTGYKDDLKNAAIDFAERIKSKFGLEPMNISFHWDEGRYEGEGSDRVFLNNYHAHVSFMNFDFTKLNQPLRKLLKQDFSGFQDVSAEAFAHLDFERGISRSITQKDHLDKIEFLRATLANEESLTADSIEEIHKKYDLELEKIKTDHQNQVEQAEIELSNKKQWVGKNIDDLDLLYKEKIAQFNGSMASFRDQITGSKKILNEVHRENAIADQRLKSKNAQIEDLEPAIQFIEHVKAHQRDINEFLETSAPDSIKNDFKRAIALLREHGIDFKTKVGRAIDRSIDLFNNFK